MSVQDIVDSNSSAYSFGSDYDPTQSLGGSANRPAFDGTQQGMSKALSGRAGIGGGGGLTHAQLVPAAPFHYQSGADGGAVVKNFFNAADKREQQTLSESQSAFNSLMKINFQ